MDISFKTLKKITRLLRNYIWSKDAHYKARAKMAWYTLIISNALGRVKIFDPINMSWAIFAKFIIKGLEPTKAPWKTFLYNTLTT